MLEEIRKIQYLIAHRHWRKEFYFNFEFKLELCGNHRRRSKLWAFSSWDQQMRKSLLRRPLWPDMIELEA